MLTIIMAEEERYNNRQVERMLEHQSADLKSYMDMVTKPILEQVLKTNGRVTVNEKDIVGYKVWRGWMTGGMAVIMIILPLVVGFMTWLGLSVMKFDNRIGGLTQKIED